MNTDFYLSNSCSKNCSCPTPFKFACSACDFYEVQTHLKNVNTGKECAEFECFFKCDVCNKCTSFETVEKNDDNTEKDEKSFMYEYYNTPMEDLTVSQCSLCNQNHFGTARVGTVHVHYECMTEDQKSQLTECDKQMLLCANARPNRVYEARDVSHA